MPKTYYAMAHWTSRESWRSIRSFRASPPALPSLRRDNRRLTFDAALQQAEEQFRAAASIGYASRPLNLFYGLSQAGRALCALDSRLQQTGEWSPSGHGISSAHDSVHSRDPLATTVAAKGSGLFQAVSSTLSSPTDFGTTSLRALIGQLPDVGLEFEVGAPSAIFLSRPDLAHRTVTLSGLHRIEEAHPNTWSRLAETYPGIVEQAPDESLDDAQTSHAMSFQENDLEPPLRDRLRHSARYRSHDFFLPRLGATDEPAHPIALWWLTLFALSTLARYRPAVWTKALTIASHTNASLLEFVMDDALTAVPELLAQHLLELKRATEAPRH